MTREFVGIAALGVSYDITWGERIYQGDAAGRRNHVRLRAESEQTPQRRVLRRIRRRILQAKTILQKRQHSRLHRRNGTSQRQRLQTIAYQDRCFCVLYLQIKTTAMKHFIITSAVCLLWFLFRINHGAAISIVSGKVLNLPEGEKKPRPFPMGETVRIFAFNTVASARDALKALETGRWRDTALRCRRRGRRRRVLRNTRGGKRRAYL